MTKNAMFILGCALLIFSGCAKEEIHPKNTLITPTSTINAKEAVPADFWIIVGAINTLAGLSRPNIGYFTSEWEAINYALFVPKLEYKYNNGSNCKFFIAHGVEELTTFGQTYWILRYRATSTNGITINTVGDIGVPPAISTSLNGATCSCGGSRFTPWRDYDGLNHSPVFTYIPSQEEEEMAIAVPIKTFFPVAECF
ncbi:MAG: hypothetical protein AAGD05_08545 [Bacteroidota bacterium]